MESPIDQLKEFLEYEPDGEILNKFRDFVKKSMN